MIDVIPLFQLLSVICSWSLSQIIKGLLGYLSFTRKSLFLTSGGMPSAHTASASAFFFSELFFHGFTSLAVLSLMFVVVIGIDAIGVRYATGKNAHILEKIITDKKMKQEVVIKKGHKKIEVIAGFILGAIIALMIFSVV